MLWFFNGNERTRWPVALENALSTAGEPTICVAAPAVLNAFSKATGQRVRSFPLKNHNIQMS